MPCTFAFGVLFGTGGCLPDCLVRPYNEKVYNISIPKAFFHSFVMVEDVLVLWASENPPSPPHHHLERGKAIGMSRCHLCGRSFT